MCTGLTVAHVCGAVRAYVCVCVHVCVCVWHRYDAVADQLIAERERPKPIWSVTLAPDAAYIAVAGYDMCLTIYDASSLEVLQTIK